jgi:hypothetical protein
LDAIVCGVREYTIALAEGRPMRFRLQAHDAFRVELRWGAEITHERKSTSFQSEDHTLDFSFVPPVGGTYTLHVGTRSDRINVVVLTGGEPSTGPWNESGEL